MAITLDKVLPLPPMDRVRECMKIAGGNEEARAYTLESFQEILASNGMKGQFDALCDELFGAPKPEVLQSAEMDIVINDENKIDRGYLLDGEGPEDDRVDYLDSAFHGWLRQEGMLCRGQIIYEGDADTGEVKTNPEGEQVQIEPAVLKAKLLDPVRGLQQHYHAHLKGVELKTLNVDITSALGVDEALQPE